ncbi:hypothetical protein AB6A40_006112 [Gnathostoma spinigerum]|uniref:Uncharacterized protein n=1 Tax=Gnathostoma spinigerum TaxID=75299 RepID=A0ABD6EHF9_9BILA
MTGCGQVDDGRIFKGRWRENYLPLFVMRRPKKVRVNFDEMGRPPFERGQRKNNSLKGQLGYAIVNERIQVKRPIGQHTTVRQETMMMTVAPSTNNNDEGEYQNRRPHSYTTKKIA